MPFSSDTIVESFGAWANENNFERFWGIAKTGAGQVCLLLPTFSDDYRAVLIEDDLRIHVVFGSSASGFGNFQDEVGDRLDSPDVIFERSITWLLDTARESFDLDLKYLAHQSAHVAARIAHFINRPDRELEALALIEKCN